MTASLRNDRLEPREGANAHGGVADEGHDRAMRYITGLAGVAGCSYEEAVSIYLRARGILTDGAEYLAAPIPEGWGPAANTLSRAGGLAIKDPVTS